MINLRKEASTRIRSAGFEIRAGQWLGVVGNTTPVRFAEGDFGDGGAYVLNNYNSHQFSPPPGQLRLTARLFWVLSRTVSRSVPPFRNSLNRLSPKNYLKDSSIRAPPWVTSYIGTIRVQGQHLKGSAIRLSQCGPMWNAAAEAGKAGLLWSPRAPFPIMRSFAQRRPLFREPSFWWALWEAERLPWGGFWRSAWPASLWTWTR